MFARASNQGMPGWKRQTELEFDSPLDELNKRMGRLESLMHASKADFLRSLQEPSTPTSRSMRPSIVASLKKLRNRSIRDSDSIPADLSEQLEAGGGIEKAPTSGASAQTLTLDMSPRIVPMTNADSIEIIECLRRIAELVIVGERVVAKDAEMHEKIRGSEGEMSPEDEEELRGQRSPDADQYTSLFDEFFEKNGLELIVNIATGRCFQGPSRLDDSMIADIDNNTSMDKDVDTSQDLDTSRVSEMSESVTGTLLAPILVATQAIQSVSLLVQNVSRATSLYFILSGNHVNEMVDMPLDKYKEADWKNRSAQETLSQRKYASPELSELTTHFVTFLKSLALRMNAETLQFFLTYPMEQAGENDDDDLGTQTASASYFSNDLEPNMGGGDDDRPLDEITEDMDKKTTGRPSPKPVVLKEVEVRFPLYARALEYCSPHQDSFVRVTAMNICLNTLRLATVQPGFGEEEGELDFDTGSSPDGVLHNARSLPFRERLSIAQHVCSPSRVERLVSPIFTKLAQLWGILEEKFREVGEKDASAQSSSSAKIAKAKEVSRRQRMTAAFKDIAYKLQDELELLEDVLKVGLTSLNEQVIEMMLATFVYPLILQPLILYFQRSKIPDAVLNADPLHDHTTGRRIKAVDYAETEKSFISAPAKSAFFMLSSVFYSVTNQPLLHLLFCALFHPRSPDASGETMIRAKADVACMDADGKKSIRVDPIRTSNGSKKSSAYPRYLFGTVTGQKFHSSNAEALGDNNTCTFVLSPALAEVFESKGGDYSLIARTRQNPYRKAIFKCCTLSHEISDLKPLAILAIDAAVSALDGKIVTDIFHGLKFESMFKESTPLDERRSDSSWARMLDDRGMGGPIARDSRQSFGDQSGGKAGFDFVNEILTSFRSSVMCATPGCNGNWKLVFDPVAAHAFLTATRANPQVLAAAAKGSSLRSRQAAGFLSDMPQAIEKFLGSAWVFSTDSELRSGMITDVLFHVNSVSDSRAVVDQFRQVKEIGQGTSHGCDFILPVACPGSLDELCTRACSFPPAKYSTNDASIEEAMSSAQAWVQTDAFCNFITSLARDPGSRLRDRDLGGFAVLGSSLTIDVDDRKAIFGAVSRDIQGILFGPDSSSSNDQLSSGTIISLVGHTAIPCVCEAPPSAASLFSADSARTMSEGVTWQSLYLILLDGNFILTEPHRRSSSDGRVVSSCALERLDVKRDESESATSTVARRLLIHHCSYNEDHPPGLFLLEESPGGSDGDSMETNAQRHPLRSSMDVWFENQNAVEQAFSMINDAILHAKASRGQRIRQFLADVQTN